MPKHAATSRVDPHVTEGEIKATLRRYGAKQYIFATNEQGATVVFDLAGRRIKLEIPFPAREDLRCTPAGRERSEEAIEAARWQGIRQRWRALALVIKAKLEATECGITTLEDEFLANVLLPNNSRIADWIRPQLENSLATGKMPPMLPR